VAPISHIATRAGWRLPGIAGLLVAGLCVSCHEAPPRKETAGERPNILLIVVDTLRADRLGSYGFAQPTSPDLDALAGRGVRLERFSTAAPSTLASFTSMLTSRYPHSHGVYRNGVPWPADLEGVQSLFQAADYATAGFVASYCLASHSGISRGFGEFDENLNLAMPDLPQNKLIRRGADVTDAVVAWLERIASGGTPFFAMVHYFDPHWPYQPPPPYDTLFGSDQGSPVTGAMQDLLAARRRLARSGGRPDADSHRLHDLHLGEIRYTDEQIGRVISAAEALGLMESTLIVVTADHGETFWDHHDYFSHGLTVYDSNIRIPFIAVGPRIAGEGRVIDVPLSNIDLAPTLLEYAGLEIPDEYEGFSFLPLLLGAEESGSGRELYAEATRPHHVEQGRAWPNRLKARCVMQGGWKLIQTPWQQGRYELYDLLDDPEEATDLWGAPAEPAEATRMAVRLETWSESGTQVAGEDRELDPEVRERLRALGYVD
jgi:arylsulfatase A-like enzyme